MSWRGSGFMPASAATRSCCASPAVPTSSGEALLQAVLCLARACLVMCDQRMHAARWRG